MHEYLSEHYLPMRFNLRRLRVLLDRALLGGDTADLDGVAFRLLLFLRQRKYLRDKRGGLFFGSAAGEQLASAAISALALRLPSAVGMTGFSAGERLMPYLRVDDEQAIFQSRLQSAADEPQSRSGAAAEAARLRERQPDDIATAERPREEQRHDWSIWRAGVEAWVTGKPDGKGITVSGAASISAFLAELLWIESNRPFYEFWYRETLFKQERIDMLKGLWEAVSEPLETYRQEYDRNATPLGEAFSRYIAAASEPNGASAGRPQTG